MTEEEIKEILSEERNGIVLPAALIMVFVTYLSGTLEVETQGEFPQGPEEWFETFKDAWETEKGNFSMPSLFSKRLGLWVGLIPPRDESTLLEGTSFEGTLKASKKKTKASKKAPPVLVVGDESDTSASDDEDAAEPVVVIGDHDKERARTDMAVQRLSGARMMALSVALEVGSVVPLGSVKGMLYGSNARLFDLVKQSRKAGVDTLGSLLNDKNKVKIGPHFTSLMRDYTQRGLTEETSLISSFWVETQRNFDGDWVGLMDYLDSYFKTYSGRGLPTPFDISIAWRVRQDKGTGGKDSEAVKEVQKLQKESTKDVAKLQEQLINQRKMFADLKGLVTSLRTNTSDKEASGGGKVNKPYKGKCKSCGEFGHHTSQCPNEEGSKQDE